MSINVKDVDAALAFYVEVLGCSVRGDRPDFGFGGAWLDVGHQQVHLIEATTPDNKGQHFAVQVADIDAAVADIRRHGVTVSDPMSVGVSRQAFLEDPSGNVIEIHQVGSPA